MVGIHGVGNGTRATYIRIPDELEFGYKNDDGHEPIKLVMTKHEYELGENEFYLDDFEDIDWR